MSITPKPTMGMDVEAEILGLVGLQTTHRFNGAQVLKFRRPCVYVWVRGDEVLYVGKGSSGIGRPFSRAHHRLRDDAIVEGDSLLIYECPPGTEAALEDFLIAELKPSLNGTKAADPPSQDTVLALTGDRSDLPKLADALRELDCTRKAVATSEQQPRALREEIERLKEHERKCASCQRGFADDEGYEGCEELCALADALMGAVVYFENGGYVVVEYEYLRYLRRMPFYELPEWLKGADPVATVIANADAAREINEAPEV